MLLIDVFSTMIKNKENSMIARNADGFLWYFHRLFVLSDLNENQMQMIISVVRIYANDKCSKFLAERLTYLSNIDTVRFVQVRTRIEDTFSF